MVVNAVNGIAAASTSVKYSGTCANATSSTAIYSANAPMASIGKRAKTRSPTLKRVTCSPTFSIVPTNSFPATWGIDKE